MSIMPEIKSVFPDQEYEPSIRNGKVVAVLAKAAIVDMGGEKIKAQKAFSCLVDPEAGDTVICCKNEDDQFYILGIMEREDHRKQQMKISLPADATLESGDGSISILAKETATIASENLNLICGETLYKSHSATFSLDSLTATGNTLQASYKTVNFFSHIINTMAKHVFNRFKDYIRNTESSDQVKARQMTRNADGVFSLETGHTIMVSKESTKIDGKKILMG
ncbi:hypothetical protein MTBBW1_80225 [Desulfamplus magnetovallimortis]|uniref:DUF3540 domain-containing protein n=1 Tax=Desulfamplus magnetovallimortis TaxID=1246637 RepID=L0R794_9BACT|nr:DUF3540 domain-containing protein [Desulfamplus magnetovallimortis]CCO06831.1 hypothetical protein DEMABW1_80225 [Desulfamplus magnetovallimortis BW-1]SLM32882.1 hypothetical protein MTBBW1_80225 [Desulfamplus magnetovallimortis]